MAQLKLTFWGVRGSLATPGRSTAKYGGNTACLEVVAGEERIILDMGSGLAQLGKHLRGAAPMKANIFLSHYHWDHILGLPFFGPAYDPRNELVIHGAPRLGKTVREILAGQMINPYFPVSLAEMRSTLHFHGIESGGKVHLGDTTVIARELAHPGGALGFRIERGGSSIVYATDFEHGCGGDEALIELSKDADVLVYDATYGVAEYRTHVGWGHSTWAEGVRFAKAANVKRLVLFHHDPAHDDSEVDELLRLARAKFKNTEAAREGRTISLGSSRSAVPPAKPRRTASARTAARRPTKVTPKAKSKAAPKARR
jgi:phosphoribosyl 1,2-cyclic phosphodiesterase